MPVSVPTVVTADEASCKKNSHWGLVDDGKHSVVTNSPERPVATQPPTVAGKEDAERLLAIACFSARCRHRCHRGKPGARTSFWTLGREIGGHSHSRATSLSHSPDEFGKKTEKRAESLRTIAHFSARCTLHTVVIGEASCNKRHWGWTCRRGEIGG